MSMQQIMRWRHGFIRIKGGWYSNLWANGENPNVKGITHQNCQLPFLSHSPNHLVLTKIGWSSYCMGMGRVWAWISNLGKIIFYFWGKKTPKMHAHLLIHTRSSFAHAGKSWELFYLHVFAHFPHLACLEILFWCCSASGKGTFSFWDFMAVIWFI